MFSDWEKIRTQLENISSENVTSLKEKDLTKGVDLLIDSNGSRIGRVYR